MDGTRIAWTDATWNPLRGCSRVSEGCRYCYAEAMAARFSDPGQPYAGLARRTSDGPRWTGEVRLVTSALEQPLRWKRPRRIFVNSMSDLFHEALTDEQVIAVFDVMRRCAMDHPGHVFQVLTKRAGLMQSFCSRLRFDGAGAGRMWLTDNASTHDGYPLMGGLGATGLRNIWLGVSVEDQRRADERIPLLLRTPAAVRFLSVEPLLEAVDLSRWIPIAPRGDGWERVKSEAAYGEPKRPAIDWVIVGGESGPKARPCDVAWIRSIVAQCRAAGVSVFVKQLGARASDAAALVSVRLKDPKGGDPAEWPVDLRVQEYPDGH